MSHDSPAPPWWQTLPQDYYLSAFETAIDRSELIKVLATAAVDQAARTGLGTLTALALRPSLRNEAARAPHPLDSPTHPRRLL